MRSSRACVTITVDDRPTMNALDSGLLDVTEWLCRRFQLLTGRTNVWLAVQITNLSIVVYFVWAVIYFWDAAAGMRLGMGIFGTVLLYALAQTVLKVPIESYENSAYRRVSNGLRNPRRIRDAALRISFLTLSIVLVYPILLVYLNPIQVNFRVHAAVLSYALILLTTIVLYVLACDPLPPTEGKATAWLRRLLRSSGERHAEPVRVPGEPSRRN
jgi:hypothetical protein